MTRNSALFVFQVLLAGFGFPSYAGLFGSGLTALSLLWRFPISGCRTKHGD